MEIANVERLRLNNTDMFIDVDKFNGNSAYGLQMLAYQFAFAKLEIRKKDRQVVMLVYRYDDIETPEYWKDAEVIFSQEGDLSKNN